MIKLGLYVNHENGQTFEVFKYSYFEKPTHYVYYPDFLVSSDEVMADIENNELLELIKNGTIEYIGSVD